MDKIVNAINNLKINYTGYELNKLTTSGTQVDLTGNPDTVTRTSNRPDIVNHTSNGIFDENLLSCGTIVKVSASSLPANTIVLAP